MSKKQSKNFWGVLGKLHSDTTTAEDHGPITPEVEVEVEETPKSEETEILSLSEKRRLEECEKIIEKGLQTFLEVGQVMLEIKDRRLYREKFGTFESYCSQRWSLSRPRAYQLIQATNVVNNLSTFVDILPTTESQTRPLAKLPQEKQIEAWKEVVQESKESGKPITAKKIEKIVSQKLKTEEKVIERNIENESVISDSKAEPEDKLYTIVDKSELIKRINKAASEAEYDIMVEVSGSWLIKSGLVEAWMEVRQAKDLVINDDFKDYITLKQAETLGIIKKA